MRMGRLVLNSLSRFALVGDYVVHILGVAGILIATSSAGMFELRVVRGGIAEEMQQKDQYRGN